MPTNERFSVTLPDDALEHVQALVVGCGGIGSYTALLLAKMGVPIITLVDHDKVEEANVGTQLYGNNIVSQDKAGALATILRQQSLSLTVNDVRARFSPDVLTAYLYSPRRLIIMALDSIEARREVYKAVGSQAHSKITTVDTLIIDPRMTLETLEVNAIKFTSDFKVVRDAYIDRLMDEKEVYEEQPCGEKAIPGTGMFAASVVMSIVLRWLKEQPFPHLTYGSLECDPAGNSAPYMSTYYPENVVTPPLDASGVWNRTTGERLKPWPRAS